MDIDKILNLPRIDQRITPPDSPCDAKITVIVDHESFAEFTVSRQLLTSKSEYLAFLFAARPSRDGTIVLDNDSTGGIIANSGTRNENLYLTRLKVCDFHHFLRWLEHGRTLPFGNGYDQITIVASASRLVRALYVGCMLDSRPYQKTVMRNFFSIGVYLERPEDFVNEIFAVTRQHPKHLARRMIVAIVVAKTMVKGKRAMSDDSRKRIERGERLKSATFWELYDEYLAVRQGDWSYPETFEKSVFWGNYKD